MWFRRARPCIVAPDSPIRGQQPLVIPANFWDQLSKVIPQHVVATAVPRGAIRGVETDGEDELWWLRNQSLVGRALTHGHALPESVSIDRTIGDFRISLDPTTLGSCLLSLRFYPFTASKIVNEVLIKSLQMSKEVGFLCP